VSRDDRAAVDDRTVGALLASEALIAIRFAARQARRTPDDPPDAVLERIAWLADLVHNAPLGPPRKWRPSSPGRTSRREQAMIDRPMTWTWATSGEEGRRWILERIERHGFRWTPPPPLPTPRKNAVDWTLRRRLRVLAGWPVRTPPGLQPLPKESRALKALTIEQIGALHEGLAADADPNAVHYVFPDPGKYNWPNDERRQWLCTALLRMVDGERITGSVTMLPEEFVALPSTVSRVRQRYLVLRAHMLERDYHLWRLDRDDQPVVPRTQGRETRSSRTKA
jgi:hypothetical protein